MPEPQLCRTYEQARHDQILTLAYGIQSTAEIAHLNRLSPETLDTIFLSLRQALDLMKLATTVRDTQTNDND